DEVGRAFVEDEGAVGERRPGDLVEAAAVGAAEDPLAVQASVHLPGRRWLPPEPLRPGRFVGLVFGVSALAAGAVAGREGHRLVVKEERRPAVRQPQLTVAAAELQRAGDPQAAAVEADDLA